MSQDVATLVSETDIAIVGLAGRFPGAATPDALWANLRAGVESVRRLTDAELRAAGVPEETLQDPHYVKAAAPLEDMDRFDGAFFGFSPKEADILDPQHRHFLECAWEALEHAGHPPERFDGSIGVFGGCGMNAYFMFNLLTNPALVKSVGLFLLRHTGNDKDFLTTRVSYLLNLTGPSVGIQTACSTSLVAIHTACQHLLNRECDLALAGGVTIELPHGVGYQYEPGEILSPDGHCRAFDAASQGTVFGSGVGIVCLRRLEDALSDGDTIHAVIKGSAVNNDGATKVGYLAPSVDGQAASIIEALSIAGVEADTISYVETHGTGTPVGDPIEIAALTQAFRTQTARSGYCAIGSLKTNIGHLDTAAGVASVIKVVQALKHRELPPSLHFTQPNPSIDFAATPFRVNSALRPWQPEAGTPRRAGVSSLGVGGTNAHVILEEAPAPPASPPARAFNLFLLSAKTATALDGQAARLAAALRHAAGSGETRAAETGAAETRAGETNAGATNAGAGAIAAINLTDAAYTLAIGRRAFDRRRAVIAQDRADAVRQLAAADPTRVMSGEKGRVAPAVVMLFPGGGAQHPGMARDLYRDEPVFRAELDRALAICARLGHPDLPALVHFAAAGASTRPAASAPEATTEAAAEAQAEALDRASRELAKPSKSILSVFAIEYALARLWMSWGVQPAAMIGHSLGEYVAACLAGVMTLEEALALVAKRGELFERLPAGAMLSVTLSEAALRAALASGAYGGVRLDDGGAEALSIAAANAPDLTVVSGRVEAIARLESALTAQGVEARRLHIDVAAHSPMLDPLLEEFSRFVRTIPLRPATLRFISNLTGTWADPREVATADYWTRHLRGTVRFTDGLQTVLREPNVLLLEVGPGQTLTSLARQHRVEGAAPIAVASLRHARETHSDLLPLHQALGRLWAQGVEVDWRTFYARDRRRRVPLPTYAFDHRRHWIAPGQGQFTDAATSAAAMADDAASAARGDDTAGHAGSAVAARAASEIPAIERLTDVTDWAYRPVWVPAPAGAEAAAVTTAAAAAAAAAAVAPRNWLIFGDAEAGANTDGAGQAGAVETLSALVARGLATAGHRVTRVVSGSAFARQDDATWRMRPDAREDAGRLVADLLAAGRLPQGVVHLWLAETDDAHAAESSALQAPHDLARGFYSLLHLAQAIGDHDPEYALDLTLVTRGAELVAAAGDARSERPAQAAAYGAVRVLPRELTGFTARTIDLPSGEAGAQDGAARARDAAAHAVVAELLSPDRVSPLALRGHAATRDETSADLTRWTLTHQPVPLTDGTPPASETANQRTVGLRDRGVYLITGGFTGIGFELARHIVATTPGATLALVGRTVLPSSPSAPPLDAASGVAASGHAVDVPGVARDAAPAGTPSRDAAAVAATAIADRLAAIDALERAGATVLPYAADVTDAAAMTRVITDLRALTGALHGVLHAAGVIDDALVSMKTAAGAARVLAPKVQGALAIDRALTESGAATDLDLFVLFSSTSALLGLPGQIDYAAANAFLDAFARERQTRAAGRTLAIDWGVWSEAGMAARGRTWQAATDTATATPPAPTGHPLLGDRIRRTADLAVYEARYSPDALWVLDEHRLQDGLALLPGTGFVEMARAAWHDLTGARDVQIDELEFLSPLEVADGATRIVRITLERLSSNDSQASDAASWAFTVESASAGAAHDDAAFDEHARATLMRPAAPLHASRRRDPDNAAPLQGDRVVPGSPADVWQRQGRHMRFGPRWRTIAELRVDAGGAAASAAMALPDGFEPDLAVWQAHPALLDFATASGLAAVPGYAACPDLFVPIAYRRIVIGPLPAAFTSHARPASGARASDEDVTLDVDLIAPDGTPLAAIEGFAMRRLSPERLAHPRSSIAAAATVAAAADAGAASSGAAPRDAASATSATRAGAAGRAPLAELLAHGIRTADGVAAFTRALSADAGPELIISSIALPRLRAFVDAAFGRRAAAAPAPAHDPDAASTAQDDLDPLDPIERIVADIWRELLGLRNVGPDDDFLMSGGHSLLAVRLAARLEKRFKTRVRLSAIFDAPTVRWQAALVRPAAQAAVRAPGQGISLMNQTTETAGAPHEAPAAETARPEAPPLIAVSRDAFRRKRSSLSGHDRS